jgi:HSP20 family protein
MTKQKRDNSRQTKEKESGLGGLLDGISGFLGNLGDLAEAGDRLSKRREGEGKENVKADHRANPSPGGSLNKILNGLTDIAEKLEGIAEKEGTLSKTGNFTIPGKGKDIKGVYGFSLKTGIGGDQDRLHVEPFGNIRKDKETGKAVVQEIHEPMIDVFEEEDATLLVAEMPGIGAGDIRLDVRDDVLTIYAEKGEKKYRKEILLKHSVVKDQIAINCNNGIVEIRCRKPA